MASEAAAAPHPYDHSAVGEVHTESLEGNMKFSSLDSDEGNKPKRPLAVIVAWMSAKDQHMDKFRALYINRGFDVLIVNIAPMDVLFPVSGAQVVATNMLEYLRNHKEYDDIVFHAFSVGGYIMGEVFVKIRDGGDEYKDIPRRTKGIVTDSAVDFEGIPTGFPKGMTDNFILRKLLEWYIAIHLAVMYNVATKHYLRSSKHFHNIPLRCPALMFSSEIDEVGSPAQNRLVMENWVIRGCDVEFKCFKDSKHVSHLYKFPEEYVSALDCFLSKTGIVRIKPSL